MLEKQIDVIGAFYHSEDQTIYQEISLYKVNVENVNNSKFKEIITTNHAKIVAVEKEFVVIEKSGTKEETDKLYNELNPFGLMQFVRSGRVVITKQKMKISEILNNNKNN